MVEATREIVEGLSPLVIIAGASGEYLAAPHRFRPRETASFEISAEDPRIGIVHAMAWQLEGELRDNLFLVSLATRGGRAVITSKMTYARKEPVAVPLSKSPKVARALEGVQFEDHDLHTSGAALAAAHQEKINGEPDLFAPGFSIAALQSFYKRLTSNVPHH